MFIFAPVFTHLDILIVRIMLQTNDLYRRSMSIRLAVSQFDGAGV